MSAQDFIAEAFHRTIDGAQVELYTLKNANGVDRESQIMEG